MTYTQLKACYFLHCKRPAKHEHAGMPLCDFHWEPKNFYKEKSKQAKGLKGLVGL